MSKPQKPKKRRQSDGPPVEGYKIKIVYGADKYDATDPFWGNTVDQRQEDMERDRYDRWRGNMGEGE